MKKLFIYLSVFLLITEAHAQVFIGFNYTIPIVPLAFAGNDTTVNANASFTLKGSITGGTNPMNHYWSPGIFLNDSTLLNPTAIINQGITFTLNVSDANLCLATDQVVVTVTPNSIEDTEPFLIKISPNPNSGNFIISGLPANHDNIYTVTIRNILGALVFTKGNITSSQDVKISIGKVPAGMYLMELSDNERKICKNFFIW